MLVPSGASLLASGVLLTIIFRATYRVDLLKRGIGIPSPAWFNTTLSFIAVLGLAGLASSFPSHLSLAMAVFAALAFFVGVGYVVPHIPWESLPGETGQAYRRGLHEEREEIQERLGIDSDRWQIQAFWGLAAWEGKTVYRHAFLVSRTFVWFLGYLAAGGLLLYFGKNTLTTLLYVSVILGTMLEEALWTDTGSVPDLQSDGSALAGVPKQYLEKEQSFFSDLARSFTEWWAPLVLVTILVVILQVELLGSLLLLKSGIWADIAQAILEFQVHSYLISDLGDVVAYASLLAFDGALIFSIARGLGEQKIRTRNGVLVPFVCSLATFLAFRFFVLVELAPATSGLVDAPGFVPDAGLISVYIDLPSALIEPNPATESFFAVPLDLFMGGALAYVTFDRFRLAGEDEERNVTPIALVAGLASLLLTIQLGLSPGGMDLALVLGGFIVLGPILWELLSRGPSEFGGGPLDLLLPIVAVGMGLVFVASGRQGVGIIVLGGATLVGLVTYLEGQRKHQLIWWLFGLRAVPKEDGGG